MKYTAICPKCGSDEIVSMVPRYILQTSELSRVFAKNYICCRCGYTETWIAQEDLERVRKSVYSVPVRRKGDR